MLELPWVLGEIRTLVSSLVRHAEGRADPTTSAELASATKPQFDHFRVIGTRLCQELLVKSMMDTSQRLML